MRPATLGIVVASCALAGGFALAGLCGGDDRVLLVGGASFDAPTVRLSAESVEAIRRALYAVRPKIGMGLAPACTGTAISDTLLLTAGHCVIKGGMEAYQRHLEPRPKPVDLRLVYHVHDDTTGTDLAVFARKSGTFRYVIPVDTALDFVRGDVRDRFGFAAFPFKRWNVATWGQKKLLFSGVSKSRVEEQDALFFLGSCRDAGPEEAGEPVGVDGPAWCRVYLCADFFDGNSGSPLLRVRREGERETLSIVAVGSVSGKDTPDMTPNVGAVPLSHLRDVLPGLGKECCSSVAAGRESYLIARRLPRVTPSRINRNAGSPRVCFGSSDGSCSRPFSSRFANRQ